MRDAAEFGMQCVLAAVLHHVLGEPDAQHHLLHLGLDP